MRSFSAVGAAVVLCLAAVTAHATPNLVTNGDFATGNLSSWNVSGWFASSNTAGVTPFPGDNYFASTGCVNHYCTLSQTLSTSPGGTYDLSFAFNPGMNVSSSGADTQIFWDGTMVADVGLGALGWTVFTIDNLLASSASTTLQFSGYQNPAYNGVDAVSVVAVPEPLSIALLGMGLAAFGLSRRRKSV